MPFPADSQVARVGDDSISPKRRLVEWSHAALQSQQRCRHGGKIALILENSRDKRIGFGTL
jgi:hypothetical protein